MIVASDAIGTGAASVSTANRPSTTRNVSSPRAQQSYRRTPMGIAMWTFPTR
jgi:hypothetical protein